MRIKIKEQHIGKVTELKEKVDEAETGFTEASKNLHVARKNVIDMLNALYDFGNAEGVKIHFGVMEIELPDPDIHPARN